MFVKVLSRLLLGFMLVVSVSAAAKPGIKSISDGPDYATGAYQETAVDMSVKVIGGYIQVLRAYGNKNWVFNRGSQGMSFDYGRSHDSLPNEITLSGKKYSLDTSTVRNQSDNDNSEEPLATYFSESTNDLATPVSRIDKTGEGYRWSDVKGNWAIYDEEGQILKGGSRNTVHTRIVRDLQNRVFQVLDANSELVLTYEYVSADSDLIKSVTDYSGRAVKYQYTGNQLTEVTDVNGDTWQYEYAPNDELTTKIDPMGRETHINTIMGSVTAIVDGNGIGTEYGYDFDSLRKEYYIREEDSAGTVRERRYNQEGLLIESRIDGDLLTKVEETRNGAYRVQSSVGSNGAETKKTLDQWGNIVRIEHPDGSVEEAAYNGPSHSISERTDANGIVTRYEYDVDGNLTKTTQAAGLPEQRTVTYEYDNYGQPETITYPGDAKTPTATYQMTYDRHGNVETQTDAENYQTSFTYDVLGNVLTRTDPRGFVWTGTYDAAGNLLSLNDPVNRQYTAEYNPAGERVRTFAPNGRIARMDYDNQGRMSRIAWNGGSSQQPEISYDYNDQARSLAISDATGHQASFTYNSYNQLSHTKDPNGNTTDYQYDGPLLQRIDFPTYSQSLSYNEKGRPVTSSLEWTLGASGTQTQTRHQHYDAAGLPVQYTDAESNSTEVTHDALGRLTGRTDALGGVTNYDYDARNNLLSVTDPEGRVTRLEYNRNGKRTAEIRQPEPGELQRREYVYDGNGNLTLEKTPKGERIEHHYDAANQRIKTIYHAAPGSAQATKTVTYRYNMMGQLAHYDDGQTQQTYQYTKLGQVRQVDTNFGPFIKTQKYTYNARGLKASYTNPEGITYHYTYDANGNIKTLSIPDEGQITYNTYQVNSPTKITYPGGVRLLSSYDGLQRLRSRELLDPAGNSISQSVYHYDRENNVSTINTEHGDYDYTYDDLYRIIGAINPKLENESYTYDKVNNRLSSGKTEGTWQYNDANQLIGYDNVNFQYDYNGNLKRKIVTGSDSVDRQYFYDSSERLIKVQKNQSDIIAQYYYNPLGQRSWKELKGKRTYFLYGNSGIQAEYSAEGALNTEYQFIPNSIYMTAPVFMRRNSDIYYYQNNHLGSSERLFGQSGKIVWEAFYTAFGTVNIEISDILNNLRFPGQYYDEETGLQYNYYRDYDPELGRYIQIDPAGLNGGLNLYLYANGNPASKIDPYGLAAYSVTANATATWPIGGGLSSGYYYNDSNKDYGVVAGGSYNLGAELSGGVQFSYLFDGHEQNISGSSVEYSVGFVLGDVGMIINPSTNEFVGWSVNIGEGVGTSFAKTSSLTWSVRDFFGEAKNRIKKFVEKYKQYEIKDFFPEQFCY